MGERVVTDEKGVQEKEGSGGPDPPGHAYSTMTVLKRVQFPVCSVRSA